MPKRAVVHRGPHARRQSAPALTAACRLLKRNAEQSRRLLRGVCLAAMMPPCRRSSPALLSQPALVPAAHRRRSDGVKMRLSCVCCHPTCLPRPFFSPMQAGSGVFWHRGRPEKPPLSSRRASCVLACQNSANGAVQPYEVGVLQARPPYPIRPAAESAPRPAGR